ncbi:MAG: hypothetical protein WC389_18350 [Lutibacter sp.]
MKIKDNKNDKIYTDKVLAFIDGTADQVYLHYLQRKYKNNISNDLTISVSKNKPTIENNDNFKRI